MPGLPQYYLVRGHPDHFSLALGPGLEHRLPQQSADVRSGFDHRDGKDHKAIVRMTEPATKEAQVTCKEGDPLRYMQIAKDLLLVIPLRASHLKGSGSTGRRRRRQRPCRGSARGCGPSVTRAGVGVYSAGRRPRRHGPSARRSPSIGWHSVTRCRTEPPLAGRASEGGDHLNKGGLQCWR